ATSTKFSVVSRWNAPTTDAGSRNSFITSDTDVVADTPVDMLSGTTLVTDGATVSAVVPVVNDHVVSGIGLPDRSVTPTTLIVCCVDAASAAFARYVTVEEAVSYVSFPDTTDEPSSVMCPLVTLVGSSGSLNTIKIVGSVATPVARFAGVLDS